jgi:DNA-binding transcriptional LysR family regulator
MHSRLLEYFEAVVRYGSVRKAGEAIHVSPSAINRHLIDLETEIGSPLFDRLPRGMRLTAAGEILALHVRSTLRDYRRALSEIQQLAAGERGEIRIACIESALAEILPDILARFSSDHPLVRVRVLGLPARQAIEATGDETTDLCILFNPPRLSLTEICAVNLPLGIVVAADHALAGRRAVRLVDLVGQDLVMPDDSITISEQVAMVLAGSGLKLQPRVYSSSITLMQSYVELGQAVTIMTPVGIRQKLAAGRLIFIPLSDPGFASQRLICATAGPSMPAAVAHFARIAEKVFGEQGA